MRRLPTALCALALWVGAAAAGIPVRHPGESAAAGIPVQTSGDEAAAGIPMQLLKEAAGRQLVISYSLTAGDEVPVTYSGTARIQQSKFRISGNGTEIISDGTAIWVVDPKAKEVYIQSPEAIEKFVKDNIGTLRDFKVSDKKILPEDEDPASFSFDAGALDKSWVVTDLR